MDTNHGLILDSSSVEDVRGLAVTKEDFQDSDGASLFF